MHSLHVFYLVPTVNNDYWNIIMAIIKSPEWLEILLRWEIQFIDYAIHPESLYLCVNSPLNYSIFYVLLVLF